MSYVGGKHAIRREVAALIINECQRTGTRRVWEPFCGGLHITAALGRRGYAVHASDLSKPAITYYRGLRMGWRPPSRPLSKTQWEMLHGWSDSGEASPLISYAGFSCSFNGVYFSSYDPDPARHAGRFGGVLRRVRASNLAELTLQSYEDMRLPPPGAVVYCDPPYASTDTSAYRSLSLAQRKFDHTKFWAWVRDLGKNGVTVLVSEYTAPDDIECVWRRDITVPMSRHAQPDQRVTESVFRVQGEP